MARDPRQPPMQSKLTVEEWPIEMLIPYAANARTHSDAQVAQIAASIAEFGFVNPVLIDAAGVLVAGHGRVLAAKNLGMSDVPAIKLGHLSPKQVRALRIADNKIALNSGWDDSILLAELSSLLADGFDLGLTGFGTLELDGLFAPSPGDDSDGAGSLAAKFGVPPFPVLDARGGWWQDRKRAWLALGIRSEIGR